MDREMARDYRHAADGYIRYWMAKQSARARGAKTEDAATPLLRPDQYFRMAYPDAPPYLFAWVRAPVLDNLSASDSVVMRRMLEAKASSARPATSQTHMPIDQASRVARHRPN